MNMFCKLGIHSWIPVYSHYKDGNLSVSDGSYCWRCFKIKGHKKEGLDNKAYPVYLKKQY